MDTADEIEDLVKSSLLQVVRNSGTARAVMADYDCLPLRIQLFHELWYLVHRNVA